MVSRAWIDVDQGRRSLDWYVALGDLEAVPGVTPLGREVGARAAADLESFFGPGWLAKAAPPQSRTWIADLHHYWPSLGIAGAYGNAIALWASLRLLVNERVRGIGELQKALRNNFEEVGFQHALTQARLAAQGVVSGHRVILEPRKTDGNPGDLAFVAAGNDVFVEIKTFNPDRPFVEADRRVSAMMDFIRRLEVAHDVSWSGTLEYADLEPNHREHLSAAARTARESGQVQVVGSGADPLTVSPGAGVVGASLSGPMTYSDHGPRIVRDMSKKAIQTRAAGAAWIWMQDHRNALWPMTEFASYPLGRKIETLASLAESVFSTHAHVVGIVLTSASMLGGPVEDETERTSVGFGFRRALPGRRIRESIVLHRRILVPGQLATVLDLCSSEPVWVDRALDRLGVPGGLGTLTTHYPRPVVEQRTRSGLYLPK
jgi:hypothetical protein